MKIGIVGAGVAGLACATALRDSGLEPVLFDKGRRPGGRLSTLSVDTLAWDFGAQFIRQGEGAFAVQAAVWRQAGLLAPWPTGPAGALVPVPTMSALIAAQCLELDVRFDAQVQRIEHRDDTWFLSGPGLDALPFDAVAVAVPAEQAAPLLSLHDLPMACEAAAARSRPCWTLMAAFDQPLSGLPDFLQDIGKITWAARDNSKPGRAPAECWVIQAGADWSHRNLERDRDTVAIDLLALFAAETGQALPDPRFLKAHRWRFAHAYGQHGAALWNPQLRLGACGDWCSGPEIEGAWRSGVELAEHMIAELGDGRDQLRQTFDAA